MTACIIQARMGSTRLPGKILKMLAGKPMLWHVVVRCRKATKVDRVIVATTTNPEDDAVEAFCVENGIECFRGSSDDVLERYHGAAKEAGADTVVRVTSDCPLIDPTVIDLFIGAFETQSVDYVSNIIPGHRSFPRGLDVEVFGFAPLETAAAEATEPYEKEHATPYIWENRKGAFRIGQAVPVPPDLSRGHRLTVDYPEDFALIERIYVELYRPGSIIDTVQALAFLDKHPEVASLNASCEQKPVKPS
ncbi:MAG: glycosyltransferase family protein [Patescibacteria group bacterium]